MNQEAIDTLSRGYLMPGETPRDMWSRVSKTAARILNRPEMEGDLFEIFWRGFVGGATPVLSNMGTNRGLPISCYSSHLQDSIHSIYSHLKEVAALSKHGGGVGVYLGDVRPSGSHITGGGKSTGVVPWARQYDYASQVVSQGGVRRGSFALYLPIDHPDLPELLRSKDHSQGDPRNFIDSQIAVTIEDKWLEGMINGDREKQKLFGEILKIRLVSGSPYLIFIDNANNQRPSSFAQRNLQIYTSNLCSEIFLPTDENHTFVCVLSSLNLARWDEWKDWTGVNTGKSVPELMVYFLDAVIDEFITKADRLPSMGRAVRFARKSRALGIGTMGLHALYQKHNLPFASPLARELNITTHKYIDEMTLKASKDMAREYGEPEWCKGDGVRHATRTAIAPTKSNSVICGAVSQGIEPIDSNYYVAKQAKGSFVRKNPYLLAHLESIGHNTEEVWDSILEFRGSVQHLPFLDERAKDIFKTAREIDQFEIIKQASDRQPHICQGQSVNLFVDPESTPTYLLRLHLCAWKAKLKSLYYLKSSSLLVKKTVVVSDQNPKVKIFSKPGCPYCERAKLILRDKGYNLTEAHPDQWSNGKFPFKTVPQIWIGDNHIGGYEDLLKVLAPGVEERTYEECEACQG